MVALIAYSDAARLIHHAMPTSRLSLNNTFLFVVLLIVAITLQQSKQYFAAPMHCG